MSWLVDEPGPDAAEDLQRLAEEERRLAIVLEHERRQQAGRRQQVPGDEDRDQEPELPGAQVLHRADASHVRPRAAAGSRSALPRAAPPRSPGAARRSAASRAPRRRRAGAAGRSRTRRSDATPARPRADHAVAQRDRLVEVVGDEEHRLLLLGPEREHLVFHQLARLHVERGERLVHQDDVGVEDQRLREADALSHAARELVRIAVAERAEADPLQPFVRRCRSASAAPRNSSPAATFSQRGPPRHQALGLEHVAGAPVDAGERARRTRSTRPLLGASRPAATLSSVLLPQPVGPTTETNSPRRPRA